jgi:ATP/maltotriose-dependent transcriptional regulator MalT
VAWDLGRFADAHGLLDAADHALAGIPACTECVDVEEIRIRFAGRAGDLAALEDGIARLAALGRTVGSRRSRAAMLFGRMALAYQTGRYVDGLGIADELLALAHDQESPLLGEAMLRPVTAVHLCWGDLAGARAVLAEGLRVARQIGVPAIETFQSTLLALADMLTGEWETALRRTFNARSLAQRVGFARGAIYPLGTEAMLLVRLGRLDEAADRVSEGQRLFGKWSVADRHVFALIDLAEGMVALGRHELDHALEIAAGKATRHPSIPPLALAFLGEVQAAVGDMNGAQETASRLAGLGPGAPFPAALAAWVSGLGAGARRDPVSAIKALDDLDRAIGGFAELEMPYEEAVARLDRAPVRYAAGHSADAVAEDISAALEVLDRLQAKPQVDRARAMLRELDRRPAPPPGGHVQRRLSGREEEVARLVAQGLSNAEVGERLFISSRTVSTHLQHIYRRLGLPSRAALIRYVVDGSHLPEVTSPGGTDT